MARPYAYAICGEPISEVFRKGIFKLTWVASDDCYNKKTELFLSDNFYFPKGMNINFSKNCNGCSLELLKG